MMEAVAVDKLVEKGDFRPQVAQAIAEAIDITIKAANLATVPMLDARFVQVDARFAQADAKMEARFAQVDAKMETRFAQTDLRIEARYGAIEKSIEALKGWTLRLYVGAMMAFFSAIAVDHHWIVNREDQLIAQVYARNDARFAALEAHADRVTREVEARLNEKLDDIRRLLPANVSPKSSGGAGHASPPIP